MKHPVSAAVLLFLSTTPLAAENGYFPLSVWGSEENQHNLPVSERDAHYEQWYGGHLARFGERPLWVERSVAGVPLAIRISSHAGAVLPETNVVRLLVKPDGTVTFLSVGDRLRLATEPAKLGEHPSVIPYRMMGTIEPEKARAMLRLIEELAPFSSTLPSLDPAEGGFDGTDTLLEFSRNGTYNLFQRRDLGINDGQLGRLMKLVYDATPDPYPKN